MTSEQLKQVKLLMEQFGNLTPSQEKYYLDMNCNDEVVRTEVEALLAKRRKNDWSLALEETKTTLVPDSQQEHEEEPKIQHEEPKIQVDQCFDNLIGTKFNETYLVEEKLGQGGMGAVFRCTHLFLGTQVAIKVMLPAFKMSINDTKRFQREARVGWSLSHPNIIKVLEFSQTPEGLLFMVMEFIKGETLKSYIKRLAPLTLSRCVEIMRPLCNALDMAHKRNLLHRDIKPANILISQQDGNEVVKLADFGIVKLLDSDGQLTTEGTVLTGTDTVMGSIDYMSPEQLMNYKLGPASDIYSLGIILHEMLTTRLPIQGTTIHEIIKLKTKYTSIPPPSHKYPFLPPSLDGVFLKVLSPTSQNRYQKAGDLLNAISNIAS